MVCLDFCADVCKVKIPMNDIIQVFAMGFEVDPRGCSKASGLPPTELMAEATRVLEMYKVTTAGHGPFVAQCERHSLGFELEVAAVDATQAQTLSLTLALAVALASVSSPSPNPSPNSSPNPNP